MASAATNSAAASATSAGDLERNGGDAVGVGVNQVAGMNRQAADAHGAVQIHDVAVAVGADHAVAEGGEAEAANLVQIARGARW